MKTFAKEQVRGSKTMRCLWHAKTRIRVWPGPLGSRNSANKAQKRSGSGQQNSEECQGLQVLAVRVFRAMEESEKLLPRARNSLHEDVPIYVAHDSADVWANPDLFHLDGDGRATVVSGVPPDYFSTTGTALGQSDLSLGAT